MVENICVKVRSPVSHCNIYGKFPISHECFQIGQKVFSLSHWISWTMWHRFFNVMWKLTRVTSGIYQGNGVRTIHDLYHVKDVLHDGAWNWNKHSVVEIIDIDIMRNLHDFKTLLIITALYWFTCRCYIIHLISGLSSVLGRGSA